MSRLTSADYLTTHHHLRTLWFDRPAIYARLNYRDQLYLHRYFVPTVDALDHELLAHRRRVSATSYSLPQCAGRAYRRLRQLDQS